MSGNTNFICYQGYSWERSFKFMSCEGDFSLAGYGVDIYIYAETTIHLSVGSGITMSGATATASLTSTETGDIGVIGLPVETITEITNQECCAGAPAGGPDFDIKTGPVASFRLTLTDPSGNITPEIVGKFLIYPEQQ